MENKMIEVHDNNLSQNDVKNISDLFMGDYMEWFYNEHTVNNTKDNQYDSPQLVHLIFDSGEIYSQLMESIGIIPMSSGKPLDGIHRIKSNMMLGNNLGGAKHNTPHKDADEKHFSILYYVNDSDGDTIFFDDNGKEFKRVSPKKGRMVIFDSDILHTSTPPNEGRRVVVNFILNKFDTLPKQEQLDNTDDETIDVKEN